MGLKASEEGIQIAENKRISQGWTRYSSYLYSKANVGETTLRRFWRRKIINVENFQNICNKALGLNWEKLVDWENSTTKKENITSLILKNYDLPPFGDVGCIENGNRFFNRKELLNNLFEEISFGRSISLVGESEIGKSSILYKVCNLGNQRILGSKKQGFIYLDLQLFPDDKSLYQTLCNKLSLKIDIIDATGFDLKRMLDGKSYILCLDEFEVFTEFSNYALRLLRGLAGADNAPLTLVTASRSSLSELFPDSGKKTSPIYNIFKEMEVKAFSKKDARDFLIHRLQDNKIKFTESQVRELLNKSKCHPARLQEEAASLYNYLIQNND